MQRVFANRTLIQTLPVFASFSLAALMIYVFQLESGSIALILGVIAGGLVDMDHRPSGRMKNLLVVLIGFTLSSVAVQLTLDHAWAITVVMVILALGMTMLGAIDVRYRTIAFGTLVVAIYTALAHHPGLPWYSSPALIVCGTLIYQGMRLLQNLLFPNRPVQEALAASFKALADYVQTKARFFAPDEREALELAQYDLAGRTAAVSAAFNRCRDALFNRLSGQRSAQRSRRQLQDFFIAQDIHERISAAYVDYRELTLQMAHSDVLFRVERVILLQALSCRDYARALLEESTDFRISPVLRRADEGLQNAWQRARKDESIAPLSDDLNNLINNLAQITRQLGRLGLQSLPQGQTDTSIENAQVRGWQNMIARLQENLTLQSPYFRHAVRQALLALLSCLIINSLNLPMGYWILLTAIFVCQPNYAATQAKIVQRIIGTLLGVVVGSLLPALAPDQITLLSLIVVANTLFFYFRTSNYGFSTLFITVQVFLGFAMTGMDTQSMIIGRLLDTVIGAAIAWACVSFLWPDWRYLSLHKLAAQALASDGRYLRLAADQLNEQSRDDLTYRAGRRRVHEHAGALAGLVRDMQQTPEKYGSQIRTGQDLVQLNYRIVSQISALAAYRGNFQDENPASAGEIRRLAEQINELLGELPQLPAPALQERLSKLRGEIAGLGPLSPAQSHATRQPLLRLLTLVEELYPLLDKSRPRT
ncbi:YccS family putative transporter [Granulosicoccaceae sp. 1_MG-2023]|nr:YccS family putative transporter [Granulosicoccaceae sp. 1_MG-2023]